MTTDLAEQLRAICLALPEVTERPSHSAPTWFVRGKNAFVTLWATGHHANEFPHLWCAAAPGAQKELIAAEPDKFFRPRTSAAEAGSASASTATWTGPSSPNSARTPTAPSPPPASSPSSTSTASPGEPGRAAARQRESPRYVRPRPVTAPVMLRGTAPEPP